MRKIYITLTVLLITMIGMAYLYFSNLSIETQANNLSLNAASHNASIVFSFENDKTFYEILSGQDLLQNILGEEKSLQLKNIKDAFLANNINENLAGQKVYISILPSTNNKVDFLICTQLKESTNFAKLTADIDKNIKIDQKDNIFEITFADTSQVFAAVKDKLIIISSTTLPIAQVLKSNNNKEIDFATYISKNGQYTKNTLANLYINFNHLPALLKNILNSNLVGELSIFNKQSTFATLSYNYSTEKLLFNGTTTINNNKNYYNLFANIAEQKITINAILPEKTANYTSYSFNDYSKWQKDLGTWFNQHGETKKLTTEIEKINETYRIDLKEDLSAYFKNQFITFQLNTGEKFGAIALNNGERVSQLLLDLSAEYAPDIRIFKDKNIPYFFFGEPFKKFERPFYTIIDNYLVMANYASSIQVFLNNYSSGKLLANTADYIKFRDQISSSATICFYVNNKNSNDIFGKNLKLPYFKQYQSAKGFRNYDAFCYQLSGDKGNFLTNLLLYKKEEKSSEPDTLKLNP